MDEQLQELIDLQREQNQLLKNYLWRFRFSLMSLLVLTTATAAVLGFLVYQGQTKVTPPPPTIARFLKAPPQGTVQIIDSTPAPWESPRYDLIKTD